MSCRQTRVGSFGKGAGDAHRGLRAVRASHRGFTCACSAEPSTASSSASSEGRGAGSSGSTLFTTAVPSAAHSESVDKLASTAISMPASSTVTSVPWNTSLASGSRCGLSSATRPSCSAAFHRTPREHHNVSAACGCWVCSTHKSHRQRRVRLNIIVEEFVMRHNGIHSPAPAPR
jgi:hypothetical protein